ncbi:MAG: hypothetical protein ACWA5T_07045 [Parvularcula sp.]
MDRHRRYRLGLGLLLVPLSLSGCVVGTAVGVAGDVVEGTAKGAVFTAKTAGKVAGAAIPDRNTPRAESD